MGYRIVYSRGKTKHQMGKKFLVIAIAVVAVMGAIWRVSDGIRQLPEAALESMVDTVRDGGSVSEAITAFCQEIIENAS